MLLGVIIMIKICVNCGVEFVSNSGKQVCCSKKCNVEKWRKLNPEKDKQNQRRAEEKRKGVSRYNSEVRKEWYRNKSTDEIWKDKINNQYNKRRQLIQEFIGEYKLSKGCADCGYNKHHVALDFDHVDGEKELNVCNAKSIKQAKKEIEKCEVVCSNCHRIRTYNRLHEGD
jgi:predicted  nucleic acid-binding Zn-ribbon protein